jgi:hypothetical protein
VVQLLEPWQLLVKLINYAMLEFWRLNIEGKLMAYEEGWGGWKLRK